MGYPPPDAVSGALRRDAGIIPVPRGRIGYTVTGGMGRFIYPSISVSISDHSDGQENIREAQRLRDHLVELGWEI
jgi:hypothetical protein